MITDPRNTMRRMHQLRQEWSQQYAGMGDSRFRKTRPGVGLVGADGDWHSWPEARFVRMREYAEAMFRDDATIKMLIDRARINTIRTGFGYEPDTGDDKLDADLLAEFNEWAQDADACDVAGQFTFADFQSIGFIRELVSGDCFIVGTEDGRLQAFEAYRCGTPRNRTKRNIVQGIELDEFRRRVRYYFSKETPGVDRKYNRFEDFHEVPAYETDERLGREFPLVWHWYSPFRFTMTRGVTALHPCFDKAGMYEDIDFALLVKEQAAACFVGSWESDKDAPPGAAPSTGSETAVQLQDGQTMLEMGVSPGQILTPPAGKKLVTHSPNVPSAETLAHLKLALQIISVNLGVPLNVGLMDANDSGSYSAYRGALDQAKLGWIVNQNRIESRFHRHVVTWRLRWRMSQGDSEAQRLRALARASRPGSKINLFRHRWQKPRWPYQEPVKDAAAGVMRTETFQQDGYSLAGENGLDGDEVIARSIAFNKKIVVDSIRAAQDVKAETGVDVHWRDIANRAVPKGAQVMDFVEQVNKVGGEDDDDDTGPPGSGAKANGNGRGGRINGNGHSPALQQIELKLPPLPPQLAPTVEVHVPEPRKRRKVIRRDAKGLISEIREEEE